MSEIVDFETVIALGAAVGAGVLLLAGACAVAGYGLAKAIEQVARGGQAGFTAEMQRAIGELRGREQASVEESVVDGLRSLRILRQAFDQMAKDRNGQVIETVATARGRSEEILVGLRFSHAEAGIGVRIDGHGNMVLVADPTIVDSQVIDEVRADLETTYTSIAVAETMKTLKYSYAVSRPSPRQCLIVGERT